MNRRQPMYAQKMFLIGVSALAALAAILNVSGHSTTKAAPSDLGARAETRCGWFSNPTPANAWLTDADGEWTIAVQGGYQAEGDWPDFKPSQWVKTNVNYGYGCSCMRVTSDRGSMRIVMIHSATPKSLATCRKDKALKGKEPK